jgi:hypothetical protein
MPLELLAAVVTWLLYFGLSIGIMLVDRKLQAARERKAGTESYADRRIWPYLVFAFFCGPLPLIMYFYGTRRSGRGALIGLGMAVAHGVVVSVIGSALMHGALVLEVGRQCGGAPPASDGTDCVFKARQLDDAGLTYVDGACQRGGLYACVALAGYAMGGLDPDADRTARAKARSLEICKTRGADPLCR